MTGIDCVGAGVRHIVGQVVLLDSTFMGHIVGWHERECGVGAHVGYAGGSVGEERMIVEGVGVGHVGANVGHVGADVGHIGADVGHVGSDVGHVGDEVDWGGRVGVEKTATDGGSVDGTDVG